MVYPDRQRQRQKERGRYGRNRSPSNEQDLTYKRSRSRSDEKKKYREPKEQREWKQKPHYSYNKNSNDKYDKYEKYEKYERSSHSKKRSESRQGLVQQSSSEQFYEERQEEQLEQAIRLGLRSGNLHYNKKAHEAYMMMPEKKQEELADQARSIDKIHECILVRQLFISGLNDISQYTITQLMGKYGEIQNIEIIKDFAFVKYFRVEDASNACADYHNINASVQPLINANFKIFFSDHLKRWNVVSNNPDYQIRQYLVPVIYASVKNDPHYSNQKYLMSIFKKYGCVKNLQLRKNEFPGPKIHVNVEYQTLDMALRARDRLKNSKDKFGQKKTEIAILIDSQKITRVFPNVGNQIRYQKKRLQNLNPVGNPLVSSGNSFTNLNNIEPYGQSQGPNMMSMNSNLNQVGNPVVGNSYQTEDIFAMLDKLKEKKIQKVEEQVEHDSDWVGFFTRNNQFKVQVDFNRIHKDVPFDLQSVLNVSHRGDINEALNRTDYILAGKFKAANKLNSQNFHQYVQYFLKKNRAGIIFTNLYLIYLLPPKEDLNLPYTVEQNQLLALFFKIKN